MTYQVIVADPPWAFSDRLKMGPVRRGAAAQYNTMTDDQIRAMPVQSVADKTGCVLALWCPSSILETGYSVVRAWGFVPKQTYIWVKTKKGAIDLDGCLDFGMGRLFRQCHEIAIVATMGKPYGSLSNRSQRSVSLARNEGHSIKPPMLQDKLDVMFPEARKLELFARRKRDGWTCLGNQIDGKDIFDTINGLQEGTEQCG